MAKFCQNCGTPLADEARFCEGCGTPVPAEAPAPQQPEQPVYQQPAYQQPKQPAYQQSAYQQPVYQPPTYHSVNPQAAPTKPQSKSVPIIIGVIAGVFILTIILICVFIFGGDSGSGRSGKSSSNRSSYTDPLDTYISVMVDGKTSRVKNLAPQEYWNYLEDEEDTTIEDVMDECEENHEDYIDDLEDEFGANPRMTYRITDTQDMDEATLESIAEALENKYGIDARSVTAGKELEGELTVKGSDDQDTADMEICVIKIDGKWYWINYYSSYYDEYEVYFNIPY